MNNLVADRPEIDRAIALLFKSGSVMETRIPKTRAGVVSGYFDDSAAMASAIYDADARYRAGGIYFVLNEIEPALLGRACNRLKERAELTTADNNVVRRRWLPVDLDPVRPLRSLIIRRRARRSDPARADYRSGHGRRVGAANNCRFRKRRSPFI